MKLLYLSDIRFPMERANGIQTAETCHALAKRGVDVHLVVRRNRSKDHGESDAEALGFYGLEPDEHLKLERWPNRSRWGFLMRALLLLSRARGRWDGILTRDLVVAEMAIATKPLHAVDVFYEAHTVASVFAKERADLYEGRESEPVSPGKLARLDRRERLVCRESAGLVAITEALVDQLAARHGALAATLVARDGCRQRRSPPPSGRRPKRAFYVGQLYPWKGVDVLIDAARYVQPSLVEIVVVGGLPPEPDLERVQTLARTTGVADRIRFSGYVPPTRVEEETREADIFVVPLLDSETARWFTSPMKLFEAMASGRPIVASDLPSIREVLEHETNALLVPAGDAKALATALERLAGNEELARTLAARALENVAEYTWERRATLLQEFLEERIGS